MPDLVTHYYLPGRRPFLNLSDLDPGRLTVVLAELEALRSQGRQHRPFGPGYMPLRRLVESRLYEKFVASGGHPDRQAPHYFVLGESSWYASLGHDMRRVEIPLAALPPDKTSVTYPDSFIAMTTTNAPAPGTAASERIYSLDDLPTLIDRHGLPAPTWHNTHHDWRTWPREAFIEVQLWTDDPIGEHLAPSDPA